MLLEEEDTDYRNVSLSKKHDFLLTVASFSCLNMSLKTTVMDVQLYRKGCIEAIFSGTISEGSTVRSCNSYSLKM